MKKLRRHLQNQWTSSLPPHNPFVSESNIQAENINPQDWYKEHKIDNEWLCQQYKDVIV